jgi:hypothetical protein
MSKFLGPPGAIVSIGDGEQPKGRDKLLGEHSILGPLSGTDIRMFLDRETLTHLLDISRNSISGRVVLEGVGCKVKMWQTETGHTYQTWELVSHQPKPEVISGLEGIKPK